MTQLQEESASRAGARRAWWVRRVVLALMMVLLALTAACSQSSLMRAFGSSADEKVATHYVDLLRDHQYAQIEKDVDPSLRHADLHKTLVAMASVIPLQAPSSITIVGVRTFKSPGVYKTSYTFEYRYPDRWLLISVATQKKDGVFSIIGLTARPLRESLEQTNRFALSGKSPLLYLTLGAAVLVALLSLCALVLCARTPMRRRKWLWIVFILLGLGKFSVNWTTGQWEFTALAVQLFAAACTKPFYGAWVISVSAPLGALWFLVWRKRLQLAASDRPMPPELPKAPAP